MRGVVYKTHVMLLVDGVHVKRLLRNHICLFIDQTTAETWECDQVNLIMYQSNKFTI